MILKGSASFVEWPLEAGTQIFAAFITVDQMTRLFSQPDVNAMLSLQVIYNVIVRLEVTVAVLTKRHGAS